MKGSTAGKLLFAGVLAAVAAVGMWRFTPRSKAAVTDRGSLALELGSSPKMGASRWRIENRGLSIDRSGVVDVSKGESLEQAIQGLPAGSGYTVTVEAATKGPDRTDCKAEGSFEIAPNGTSPVRVNLVCAGASADRGKSRSILLNGEELIGPPCAVVTALSAGSSETGIGQSIALAASGVDGAGSSAGVRFSWALTGGLGQGSFDNSSSATPRFTCTAPGQLVVTARAHTTVGGDCANDSASVSLVCDNPGTGSSGSGSSSGSPARPSSNSVPGSSSGSCTPNCSGKLCGDDGCGGTCGGCNTNEACDDAGMCIDPCAVENAGGPCTATEQLIIAKKSADCYLCLAETGCLDDAKWNDFGHECHDVVGSAVTGAKKGIPRAKLCMDALECMLSVDCLTEDVEICYCGTLGAAIGCATGVSGADGLCAVQEVDGLEHLPSDPPQVVVKDFFNLNRGAGMANQIFSCAKSSHCDVCLR